MSLYKKPEERKALDAFLNEKHNKKFKKYEILESERPDFILIKNNQRIGIEHFKADTILNQYSDSESVKNEMNTKNMYNKHHSDLLQNKFNTNSSANDLEFIINNSLEAMSNFDYDKFIDSFKRIFEKHAKKIPEYRSKCDEIWFLIDIGIEYPNFTCFLKNGGYTRLNTLPISYDMLKIFDGYNDKLQKVIVCSRSLNKYKFVYDSSLKKYSYNIKRFTYTESLIPAERKLSIDISKQK